MVVGAHATEERTDSKNSRKPGARFSVRVALTRTAYEGAVALTPAERSSQRRPPGPAGRDWRRSADATRRHADPRPSSAVVREGGGVELRPREIVQVEQGVPRKRGEARMRDCACLNRPVRPHSMCAPLRILVRAHLRLRSSYQRQRAWCAAPANPQGSVHLRAETQRVQMQTRVGLTQGSAAGRPHPAAWFAATSGPVKSRLGGISERGANPGWSGPSARRLPLRPTPREPAEAPFASLQLGSTSPAPCSPVKRASWTPGTPSTDGERPWKCLHYGSRRLKL